MTQNVMSGYYGQPFQSSIDPRRAMEPFMQHGMVPDMSPDMGDTTMAGGEGQTLDQIISQNDLELQRRRSTYHPDFRSNGEDHTHARGSPMLEFGSSKQRDRADFQFDASPPHPPLLSQVADTAQPPPRRASDPQKTRARESLALDTRFNHLNPAFGSMSNYSPSLITSAPLDLDPASQFLSSNTEIPMGFDTASGDRTPLKIQPQIEQQQPIFTASPTHQPVSPVFQGLGHDSPAGRSTCMDQSLMDKVSRMRVPDSMQSMSVMNHQGTPPHHIMPTTRGSGGSTMTSPAHPPMSGAPPNVNADMRSPYATASKQSGTESGEDMLVDVSLVLNGSATEVRDHGLGKPPQPKFTNIYAPSGFDMLGVLVRGNRFAYCCYAPC